MERNNERYKIFSFGNVVCIIYGVFAALVTMVIGFTFPWGGVKNEVIYLVSSFNGFLFFCVGLSIKKQITLQQP